MNKFVLSFGIVLMTIVTQAQVVNIPDANFKAALLAHNPKIDLNNNGEIEVSEAQKATIIDVSNKSIQDMTGIESFVSLDTLDCKFNSLSKLDVTNITKLKLLDCGVNRITSLDVSKLIYIEKLNCSSNQLVELNVSAATKLAYLICDNNKIRTLDFVNNKDLTILYCDVNKLEWLDISKVNYLVYLFCSYNFDLKSICISEKQLADTLDWNGVKDETTKWSTACVVTVINDENLQSSLETIVKIFNPLGQELQPEEANQGLYIYQYSDGSTKKVMKQ